MKGIVYSGKIVEFDKNTKKVTLEYFSNRERVSRSFKIDPEKEKYFINLVGEIVDIFVVDDLIKYINLQDDEEIF